MVPKEKVSDAMLSDGGQLLHAVQFPDKSTAWVKHSDLASAFHEGGTRLDANPDASKPIRWQDAVGSLWDTLTGTGMETGPAGAQGGGGDTISKGLTNAGSGHPIKGAAQVASGVAEGVSPLLGGAAIPESLAGKAAPSMAGAAAKQVEDFASEIPSSSAWQGFKELKQVLYDNLQKAEVEGDKLGKAAWQNIAEDAMDKAAAAASAGKDAAAKGFGLAAKGAANLGKWDQLWAEIGTKYSKVPTALKLLYYYELVKGSVGIGTWASDKAGITHVEQDDARDTLFDK